MKPRLVVLVTVLALLATLSRFLPFDMHYPAAGLDALDNGWKYGVSLAAAQGRAFGGSVVFPEGPYGAVATGPYVPGMLPAMVLGGLLLGSAFAFGLWQVTPPVRRPVLWLTPFLLALVPVYDALLLTLPLVAIAVACCAPAAMRVDRAGRTGFAWHAALLLLMPALALLPLVKGSLWPGSLLAVGLVAALLARNDFPRAAVLCGAWFAVAFLLFWWLAGQTTTDLPRYFRGQYELIAGYSEAMAGDGPPGQMMSYLTCAVFVLGVAWHGVRRLDRGRGGGLLPGVAGVIFLAFKAGFVRYDFFHVPNGDFTLVLVCWLMVLMLPLVHAVLAALCGAAMLMVATHGLTMVAPARLAADSLARLAAQGHGIAHLLVVSHAAEFDRALLAARVAAPLPAVQGTTDIYSWGQTGLLASGAQWAPRPVFQSYTAYTPYLATINAEHLLGDAAPTNIFFRIEPIDGRLPALEDGPSWIGLLRRYEPVAFVAGLAPDADVAQFRRARNTAWRPAVAAVLADLTARLGDEVMLPAGNGLLWASLDVRPTLAGRLVAFAFKPPLLHIDVRDDAGATHIFRFVSGMGRSGFLLSPLVLKTRDFFALSQAGGNGHFGGRRAVSFHVAGASGTRVLWRAAYHVRVWAIE